MNASHLRRPNRDSVAEHSLRFLLTCYAELFFSVTQNWQIDSKGPEIISFNIMKYEDSFMALKQAEMFCKEGSFEREKHINGWKIADPVLCSLFLKRGFWHAGGINSVSQFLVGKLEKTKMRIRR